MKVLSIKEFDQLKNKEEDDHKKQKMHDFLHRDSQHRLGNKSIIEQGVYAKASSSMLFDESRFINNQSFLQESSMIS
jgi:hypothetical protein